MTESAHPVAMNGSPNLEPAFRLELQQLIAAGETQAALSRLHACYAADVVRFVESRRPNASVGDICQETWVAALKALPRFRFEASPRVWLFGIAKYKVIDAGRNRRRDRRETGWDSEQILSRLPLGRRLPTTPSSHLVRRERAAALEAALAQFDPVDRELLELRYVCEVMPRDIVRILGHGTPNAVSQRLLRLARQLRIELLKHDVFASSLAG